MSKTPIADYALLSDCHSAALVSKEGSVDWLCLPRFDRSSVFARLLDEDAGHWSIAPPAMADVTRRYLEHTMALETTIRTEGGVATLTEAMALDADQDGHDLGSRAPRALLRRVACTTGQVEFEMEYAPRPEFGLIHALLSGTEGGVAARGGADVLVLSAPSNPEIDGSTARLRFTLRAGEAVGFSLQHRSIEEEVPRPWTQDEIAEGIEGTTRAWRLWSSVHQRYEGPWSDLVYHSGRVLQSLMYQPTGAIVAAPTTSLPESAGGERNWDYRYAWVRDASFTLDALWVAACPDEAHKFFSWMTGTVASQIEGGSDLQIMFGIGGEHDLSERELPHLSGWRDSRPVRVGNGAWNQRQLDVYGELLDAAHRLSDQLGELDEPTSRFLVQVAEAAAARWRETDQGIWEVRGGAREFLFSKLMCWMARSSATQHMSFEYRISRAPPRTSQIPWSVSRHLAAAASATCTRNREVGSSSSPSWSDNRWAAWSSSPYTSSWRWFHAPLPTRTGRLSRHPERWGSSRSLRSCSPPIPNMICRSEPPSICEATVPVIHEKNLFASSGQAATHRASSVKLASRTHAYR